MPTFSVPSVSRARVLRDAAAAVVAAVVSAAGLAGFACAGGGDRSAVDGAGPTRRPDIVLVVIDTLRADALGALGGAHPTPAFDRLAAESFVFESAIAPSTWTLPSVASLMTSLHPTEHGLLGGGEGAPEARMPQVLGEEQVTLAEALRQGGYYTLGIVNQLYLRWKYGFGQGFDHYEGLRGQDGFKINERLAEELDALAGAAPDATGASTGGATDETADAATSPGDRPVFVYLHYLDPHWPYDYRLEDEPPPELAAADDETGLPRLPELATDWMAEQDDQDLRRRAVESLEARYALEVRWVDAAIENLIGVLAERGRWDDTILVVTSDHGEGFWEHEHLLHGHAPYEEQIRVPLVVRVPARFGLGSGRRSAPVGLLDVMPTLLELAGLAPSPQCRGRSLVPAMRGEEDADRALLVETGRERALRTRDAKLLVRDADAAGKATAVEYYDLRADPGESRNLATPCEGPCRESVRRLRELERGLTSPATASTGEGGVTREEVEELRALGYVDD